MTVVEMKSKKKKKTDAEKEIVDTMQQGIDEIISVQAREMARKYKVSKIRVQKDIPHCMTILYDGSSKKGSKETTFTGYEEMLNDDYDLIQSLKTKVCEILEFPEEWEDDIIITGLTFNYDYDNDGSLRGMVVIMQKKIENLNCPLNINTPFIKFEDYIDNYSTFPSTESLWNRATEAKILKIIDNAFKYMCGNSKTQQQKLFSA